MLRPLGGGAGRFLGWLIQLAIGLRAAVSIASERERGTWVALLMSPLEPGEIVQAKLVGSLHALRFMVGAVVLALTIAVIVGAVPVRSYVDMDGRQRRRRRVHGRDRSALLARPPDGDKGHDLDDRFVVDLVRGRRLRGWLDHLDRCPCYVWLFGTVEIQYALVSINSSPWFPMSMSTAWPLTTDLVTLSDRVVDRIRHAPSVRPDRRPDGRWGHGDQSR